VLAWVFANSIRSPTALSIVVLERNFQKSCIEHDILGTQGSGMTQLKVLPMPQQHFNDCPPAVIAVYHEYVQKSSHA
jgi:hypothetical protein